MLVMFLVLLFLGKANCQSRNLRIPIMQHTHDGLISCARNIIQKYSMKQVVYVNQNFETDLLLERIHTMNIASVITKTRHEYAPKDAAELGATFYRVYMIVAEDVDHFMQDIFTVNREPNWNPYARFLIIIKSFNKSELRSVFDTLLKLHVNSVVVANGTDTTELFTYNPFANYGCGKNYNEITEFGKCSSVTENIYPEKIDTGLRKCFYNVSVPHWPPFTINPVKVKRGQIKLGTEQYIFHLISQIEQFKYKFNFDYDPEMFSFVTNNMSVSGPMIMLQNNRTDVMLGGLLLIPSRANLFFYINGHLNIDEIRIIVKRAWENPPWKNFYLEFSPTVWALLLISLVFYWALIAILLRHQDKGIVLMTLLDSLLSHGPGFRCRQSVKLVFIMWVWCAYLVNSFYTTSLMSLTMKPSLSYQIKDEMTARARGLKPCLSIMMDRYRKAESNPGDLINDDDVNTVKKGCEKFLDSIRSVGKSEYLFTLALYSIYMYRRQSFYDQYGRSPVYSFKKPYTKVIYAMYFYKGFPMYERLHSLALRIRESGISEKHLQDHYYGQNIKYQFHAKSYKSRFAMPWFVYTIGLVVSSITFVIELASRFMTNHNSTS